MNFLIPDKKLTDNEIVKAWKCCVINNSCVGCPYKKYWQSFSSQCLDMRLEDTFDLINRLQAENERLKQNLEGMAVAMPNIAKAERHEAHKEFAERLKEEHRRITDYDEAGFGCQIFIVEEDYIDNLLKELTNEQPPNDVKCIDCEYLEFDVPYGVCSKAYKGIVNPNDCCGKGKLKGDDK